MEKAGLLRGTWDDRACAQAARKWWAFKLLYVFGFTKIRCKKGNANAASDDTLKES